MFKIACIYRLLLVAMLLFATGCGTLDRPGRDAEIYANRARAYLEKGDYEQALANYNKAVESAPRAGLYRISRGLAYWNHGDYDLALADFNKAVEILPGNPSYYHIRSLAYWKKGDFDKAIADCTKAIEIDPRDATIQRKRRERLGDGGFR